MLKSLETGKSSLRCNQLIMDTVGHNIANVNTTAFKADRVTFKESMSLSLRGDKSKQIGTGVGMGSIDTLVSQGALDSTGKVTDLAIEGRGYFAFTNNSGDQFFSRDGNLALDANGFLCSNSTGFRMQGIAANVDGTFSTDTVPADLYIPYGDKTPAVETTSVTFSCNLSSDSNSLGSIVHTNRFLAIPHGDNIDTTGDGVKDTIYGATDSLDALYDGDGNSLGLKTGGELELSWTDSGDRLRTTTIKIDNNMKTFKGLSEAMEDAISSNRKDFSNSGDKVAINFSSDGKVKMRMKDKFHSIENVTLSHKHKTADSDILSSLFQWNGGISSDGTLTNKSCYTMPKDDDKLSNLRDSNGKPLDLDSGDKIKIGGSIGNESIANGELDYTDDTTLGDFMNHIRNTLNLSEKIVGNIGDEIPSVSISDGGKTPIGSIVIRGNKGEDFSLNGLSISSSGGDDKTVASNFMKNSAISESQMARNAVEQVTSIEVFDESGASHTVNTTFTRSDKPGEWLWEASLEGEGTILGGNTGRLKFGQDGSPQSISYDSDVSGFSFNPMNGSNTVDIAFDMGKPGVYTGITQFDAPSTMVAKKQNGHESGLLTGITIAEDGLVTGNFSTGEQKSLAKVLVADFVNPAGLQKTAGSMLRVSGNSGEVRLGEATKSSNSKIVAGALERSNVDLSEEFNSLITTQRAYSASSKIVTTSDQLLQELVQLVR